jgi:MATE family multidrug resistance protein
MGYLGAPLAITLSNIIVLVILLAAACRSPAAKFFPGCWDFLEWAGCMEVLTIALPSLGMLSIEWWTFESLILMAGKLPDPSTAVSAII